jgi:pilin isopeptide linkage protein
VVKDNFEDATMIQSIEATGSYPGTVTTDGASLTWIIDKLDANESVTLTYKAYLNPKAWEGTGGDSVRKYVNNTATVAVNCDLNNLDSPTIVPCSSAGTSTEVRKTWVNKSGNTGSGNYINFTVKVNGAPTSDSVTNIYDVITDGQSTYEENGYITLTRYNSSTDSRSVDSYQVPLSQVTSNNNRRWDIDLTKVPVKDQADTKNLSGPYYYVLSYNVDASGVLEVQNSAGIGVNGVGYSKSVAVAGSAGMEWNKDWSKQQASIDYTKGIVKWKITASNTISADTEFHDFFSEELSFYHGLAWFDQDTADSILVKQYNSADGTWTTLKEGEDYTFERIERTCKLDTNTNLSEVPPFFMLETDENGNLKTSNGKYIMKTDENGEYMYYNEFSLTFTHEVKATKANYLTIEYLSKFDPTPTTSEMVAAENGDETGNPYNYSQWKIPMEGKKKEFGGGGTYIEGSNVNRDIALKKTAGTYDPATGTFYWDVELNRNSTLSGNATLEEWIPEGMTFYKAQIMSMGVLAKNNTLRKATTVNDKGEGETIEASEVTQEKLTGEDANGYSSKVLFSIKNLSAFEKIQNGQLLKNDSKSVFGKVTIRIWTKVDSDVLASLSEETTFTNKVVLTGDSLPDGGIYTTAEGTVPATGTQVFYKAQASTSAPAYVQFALNINEDSLTLADGKDLVVDDEMGDGMTLGITHKDDNNVSDYFEVYDVSGITGSVETTDSEGKLGVNVSLVQAQGTPITDQCSWEAMESAGDSEGETTTTYRFTVPDGKHVVIVYWASFTGAAGTTHDLTNTAKFYYEGKTVINDNSSWSNSLRVKTASASAYSNPYFWLQKVDQLGQPVEGAEFTLYAYDKSTGKVGDAIATGTSDSEGQIYFGHRSDNGVSLALNTIYALKETQVPKGYSNGNTDYYYIEFVKLADVDNDGYYINADKSQMSEEQVNTLLTEHQGKHPTGITVEDLTPGGTYTVTNTMGASAGYTPSVTKQINNKVISSSTQFTFTLKPASGATVYTDADCTKKLPASGTQVSINGTGEVDFSKLYFKQAGTYTFTITEDALSETAAAAGYGHDDNTYILTVVVDADESSGDLKVISSSYEIQGATTEDGATPADNAIFSNALNLEGTLNLQVKKTVKYWSQTVQAGQFSFFVTKDGEKLTDANGRELTFSTQEGGLVDISIPITQDDIGKHTYVISELVPTTGGLSGVSYTAKPVIANVTIAEGNKEVVATSIKYPNTTKENGVPLMTNEYRASGSLTLTGEKNLIMQGSGASMTVAKNQFQFVVKDGNGTQVATGSTEAGGSITFTEIKYDQMDIGQTYEYTISEVAGSELFVEYSAQPVTVEVAITDNGNGTLSITPTYSGSDPTKAVFTNNQTGVIPTGVSVDVLPFAMVVVIAGGLGALQVTRKKNNNKKTRR